MLNGVRWEALTKDRDVIRVNEAVYFWCQLRHDWISAETDEPLTGYVPSPEDENLQGLIERVAMEAHRQGKGFLEVITQKRFDSHRKQLLERIEDMLSDPDPEAAEIFRASLESVGIELDKFLKVMRA